MSVPAYPYNRHEQYLNRIATGEGDIPPYPQNREEQYLAAIVENGGGGSSGGVLVVNTTFDADTVFVCDKTWTEIHQAPFAVIVIDMYELTGVETDTARFIVSETYVDHGYYLGTAVQGVHDNGDYASMITFGTDSIDGYPVFGL